MKGKINASQQRDDQKLNDERTFHVGAWTNSWVMKADAKASASHGDYVTRVAQFLAVDVVVREFKIGLQIIRSVHNNYQTMMWVLRELSGKWVSAYKLFSNQITRECYGQERFKRDKLENICSKKGMILKPL